MPPKKSSSACWPPRRTTRAARKSVPTFRPSQTSPPPNTTTTSISPEHSSDNPTPLTPVSLHLSPDSAPNIKTTPLSLSNVETAAGSSSPKATPDRAGTLNFAEAQIFLNEIASKSYSGIEDKGKMGTLDGEETSDIPQNLEKEASEKGAARKTMLKKTVRLVKKVVKKKVTRRVPKNKIGCSNEGSGIHEIDIPDQELPKMQDVNVDETGDSIVLETMGVKQSNAIKPGPMEVENEVEDISADINVVAKYENNDSNGRLVDSMEVNEIVKVENSKESQVYGVGTAADVKNDSFETSVADSYGVKSMEDVGEKNVSSCEAQSEDDTMAMAREKDASSVGDQIVDIVENQIVGFHVDQDDDCRTGTLGSDDSGERNVCQAQMEDGNVDAVIDKDTSLVGDKTVDLVENQIDDCITDNVNLRSCDRKEIGEIENVEVDGSKAGTGLADGVLWSGEMEALERRRRRRTEIFVGGLDRGTKEDDIRKVFAEIGEINGVRLVMNGRTGKNKGFAFVRFASAADAKKALSKCQNVEICGKLCGTTPVEGNDTIFLGNIDKRWKSEDVIKLLKQIGITKIDKVTVMPDPYKLDFNRGFAFLELQTCRDAQIAYSKLQKRDVFGKYLKIKVAWAEPLIEPDEEEMRKVKSVYAEQLPSSWNEELVRDLFKKFGEIENIVLAKNLPSSRRKDFAFVNYATREAALACIEAFRNEKLKDESGKVNVKVSLAKPLSKGKQIKQLSMPSSKEVSKEKEKTARPVIKLHEPRNKGKSASISLEDIRIGGYYSTNAGLEQQLREEALWRQSTPVFPPMTGSADFNRSYPLPGRKRPYSVLGDDLLCPDSRRYPRTYLESPYPIARPSGVSGLSTQSSLYYSQRGAGYTSGSVYGMEDYNAYFQEREQARYVGNYGTYRKY